MRRLASSLAAAFVLLLSASHPATAESVAKHATGVQRPPGSNRVAAAATTKRQRIRSLFARARVRYPARQLLLRAFKAEGKLELWAGDSATRPLHLIKTYSICATSGQLGPKRRQGDGQVPEGFYQLTRFRRHTIYHRSMRVSYPNRLDRLLGRTGGAILVHGKCVTIGCIPIEDRPVEELFSIATATRRRYRRAPIPIHIFPLRLTDSGMARLARVANDDAWLLRFWRDLRAAYLLFEKTRRLPRISVTRSRRYRVSGTPPS